LKKIEHPSIKEVRGRGLFIGIELHESARPYCDPNSNERPGKSSSIMTSIAAIETALASGFPPNVEPCEPGVNTSNTPGRSLELGEYFKSELKKIEHPSIKEVRGRGLFIGIELQSNSSFVITNGGANLITVS
jgi:acetylornithine/succinyldiaminopimelate/putrescine aminotransferase